MKNIAVTETRNLTFVGHTGSGKTSLVEALLFKMGVNDRLGSVSAGSGMADYNEEEKERKITLYAKPFSGQYKSATGKNHNIVFVDTPGYLDFYGQVMCAVRASDLAVVVVDADGQHDPDELPRLYAAFVEQRADLLIGARTLERDQVPWASWFGNSVTALLTRVLLRRAIPDTQSGYRIHSRRFLEDVLAAIPGGRYETEMAILSKAARESYRLVSEPIRTIYEEDNRSSHFKKIRDSYRIYRTFLLAALRPARIRKP